MIWGDPMKKYIITLFVILAALLLCLASCRPGTVEPVPTPGDIEPVFTPGNVEPVSTPGSTEDVTPTPEPTEEPTAIPTSTPTEEPTKEPDPTEEPVIEEYMRNYVKWIEWREAHPAEYEEWKQQSYPQKPVRNSDAYSEYYNTKFRTFYLPWLDSFRKEGDTTPVFDPWYATLPYFYRCIKAYNIPKEELLEYVNWQNWSPSCKNATFDAELVDVLYSGDDNLVRERFKRDDVIMFENVLYYSIDIYTAVPAYELLRLYQTDSLDSLTETINDNQSWLHFYIGSGRLERLKNAASDYEKLKKEDEGPLTAKSAARVLGTFMEIYRYVRYSPDALAGEPLPHPEWSEDEFFPYYRFMTIPKKEIEEMALTVLAPELREVYGFMDWGNFKEQFHFADWGGGGGSSPDINIVSVDPKYYNGPVELYTDAYTLADHIQIVSADEEHAEVKLTGKSRDGGADLTYSVEFRKLGGIWYVSGGTVLDLIAQEHAVQF